MHKKLFLLIGILLLIITSYSIIPQNNHEPLTLDNLHVFTLVPLKNNLNDKTISLKDIFELKDWNHPIAPLRINKVHQSGFLNVSIYKGVTPLKDAHFITVMSNGYGSTLKRWWRGIPQEKAPIIIAYNDYKHDIIFSPCITLQYPHDRAYFTFGQDIEAKSLELVYTTTQQENPHAQIIVIGNCLGARAALYFTAQNPINLAALAIQSPFISMPQLANNISKSYVSWFPGSRPIIKWFFSSWFYNYKPENDTLLDAAAALPKHLPIFVAHLLNDTHVSNEDMFEFIKTIRDSGHHDVYLFALDSPTKKVVHGRLQETKPYVQALNAFYEKHNLPHDPELVKQGKQLLHDARHNAQATNITDWKIINY